jgi:L-ribulose-5-phosphate 3-epimerase
MPEYYLGLYEKSMPNSLSISQKLAEAKHGGFDFMEISIDETDEKLSRLKWDKASKNDLVKAMWDAGINIMTMCLSGHRKYPIGCEDEKTRMRGMEIMSDAIDFAADTGIRIIQIAGYDEYYRPSNEKTRLYFAENLKRSTEMASKKGVILAFETMETEFLNTVKKAMEWVNLINSPWLQVYPDLGNITNAAVLYGHKVADDLVSGSGHIAAMHLKESLPGKFREIPFGTGHVDFNSAVQTAYGLGVRMFVGEFWHTGNEDWKEQLQFANQFIRSKFSQRL